MWGHTNEERKIHPVNWQNLCTPKDWGGLGLRAARTINQTSLMKAGWHLINAREDLWVRTIKSKYKCGGDLIPRINRERKGSNFWTGVCHSWPQVTNNIAWRVGRGSLINCWEDEWVPKCGKLKDVCVRPLTENELHLRVNNLGSESGDWNLARIHDTIPPSYIQKILTLAPPNASRGEDKVAWKLSPDGYFTNASAYESNLDPNLRSHDSLYKKIWGWPGPERIRFLLWKIAQEALVTNTWRKRRNLVDFDECPICHSSEESIIHVFRDCNSMKQIWNKLDVDHSGNATFFSENLHTWLSSNLSNSKTVGDTTWPVVFGTALSIAWQVRNELVFNQSN